MNFLQAKNQDLKNRVLRFSEIRYGEPTDNTIADLSEIDPNVDNFNTVNHPAKQMMEIVNTVTLRDNFQDIVDHNDVVRETTSYYSQQQLDDIPTNRMYIETLRIITELTLDLINKGVITNDNFRSFKCHTMLWKEDLVESRANYQALERNDPNEDPMINLLSVGFEPMWGVSRQVLLNSLTVENNVMDFSPGFINVLDDAIKRLYEGGKSAYSNSFNRTIFQCCIHDLDKYDLKPEDLERFGYTVFRETKGKYLKNCLVNALAKYILGKPILDQMANNTFDPKKSRSDKYKQLKKIDDELFVNDKPIGATIEVLRRLLPMIKSNKAVQMDLIVKNHFMNDYETYTIANEATASNRLKSKIIKLTCYDSHVTDATYAKTKLPEETKYIVADVETIKKLYETHKYSSNEFGVIETRLSGITPENLLQINNKTLLRKHIALSFIDYDDNIKYVYKTYQHLVHEVATTPAQEGALLMNLPAHDNVETPPDDEALPVHAKTSIRRAIQPIEILKQTKIRPMSFCNTLVSAEDVIKIDGNFAYATRLLNTPGFKYLPTTYQVREIQQYTPTPKSVSWLFYTISKPHPNDFVNKLFGYNSEDRYYKYKGDPSAASGVTHPQTISYFPESIRMMSSSFFDEATRILNHYDIEMPDITFKYEMISVNFVNIPTLEHVFKNFIDLSNVYKDDLPKLKQLLSCFNHGLGKWNPNPDKLHTMYFDNEIDAVIHYSLYRRNALYSYVQIHNLNLNNTEMIKTSPQVRVVFDSETGEVKNDVNVIQDSKFKITYKLNNKPTATTDFPELSYFAYEATRLSVIDVLLNFDPSTVVTVTVDSIAFLKSKVDKERIINAMSLTYYKQTIQNKSNQTLSQYGHSWKFEDYIPKHVSIFCNDALSKGNEALLKHMCRTVLYQSLIITGGPGTYKTGKSKNLYASPSNSLFLAYLQERAEGCKAPRETYINGVRVVEQERLIVDNHAADCNQLDDTEKTLIPAEYPSATIHSALNLDINNKFAPYKPNKKDKQFGPYSAYHPGVIVIDECDAVDIDLIKKTLARFPYSIKIIIGDPNQCIPIGSGLQFSVENKIYKNVVYTEYFRYADEHTVKFVSDAWNLSNDYRKLISHKNASKKPELQTAELSNAPESTIDSIMSKPEFEITKEYYNKIIQMAKIGGATIHYSYKEAIQAIVDCFVASTPLLIITKQTVIKGNVQSPRGEVYNNLARQYFALLDKDEDYQINVKCILPLENIHKGRSGTLIHEKDRRSKLKFLPLDAKSYSDAILLNDLDPQHVEKYFEAKVCYSNNKIQGATITVSKVFIDGVFSALPNDILVAASRQVSLKNVHYISNANHSTNEIREQITILRNILKHRDADALPQHLIDARFQRVHGCAEQEFYDIMKQKMINRYGKPICTGYGDAIDKTNPVELDHIIPVSFSDISFANHHSNLEFLTAADNKKKSNLLNINMFC